MFKVKQVGLFAVAIFLCLGAAPIVNAASTIAQCYQTRLNRLDPAPQDFFSKSAIYGDIAVVASNQDDDIGLNSGSVYVFSRDAGGTNQWGRIKKILAPDGAADDRFGAALALYGETLVVTTTGDDDVANNAGSIYIFKRHQGGVDNWGFVKKLYAGDAAANDSDLIVAISGDTLVVGVPARNDNGAFSGAVYIYERNVGGPENWGLVKKILPSDGTAGDWFGMRVALSGETLLVGAPISNAFGFRAGKAYVFSRDQGGLGNWGQIAILAPTTPSTDGNFGLGIAINGKEVAVGSSGRGPGFPDAGKIDIFSRDKGGANSWGFVKQIAPSDMPPGAEFGYQIGFQGNLLIAGAPEDSSNAFRAGALYVFNRNQGGNGNWGQVSKIIASDFASPDEFGISMQLSGTTAVVGAQNKADCGTGCGAAYVVELACHVDSTPPIANAGLDKSIRAGDAVVLNGSASFDDNTPTANLTYSWSIASRPTGSNATLSGASSSTPSLSTDIPGIYDIQLVVTDEAGNSSLPDHVIISTTNLAPTAVAMVNPSFVFIGATAQFSALQSTDPEMDPLSYLWTLSVKPAGSQATLANSSSATPTLIPDQSGIYEATLVVSDPLGRGTPAKVLLTAASALDYVRVQIVNAATLISNLPAEKVTNQGNQNALLNFLSQALVALDQGDISGTRDKLEKSLARSDGCVLRGAVDGAGNGRDWITNCDVQGEIYPLLHNALGALAL